MIAALATLIAFAGLLHGFHRLARSLDLPPFAPGALTVGLSVGAFIAGVGLVGRMAGNFDAGLIGAAVLGCAVTAASLTVAPGPVRRASDTTERMVLLVLAVVGVLYAYLATKYQMHDEFSLFGHKAMIEQLRRNVYPLYVTPFPEFEARYHYGFNILAGAFARGFGLSSDTAIDAWTVILAMLMTWSGAAIAMDCDAERGAPFAGLAVHFGAGLAAVILSGDPSMAPRCLAQYHHPSCGTILFPTQLLNVFQHPVSAGVPLTFVSVLVLSRVADPRLKDRRWWLLAVASVLLMAGLSLAQIVYFALAALAALSALPFWLRESRAWWGAITLVVALGASLVLARGLGGMFVEHPFVDPSLLAVRDVLGYPDDADLYGILFAHVANLGIAFVLFPVFAGIVLRGGARPPIAMLASFALGGIIVANVWNYDRSWDIVKFPSASSFALSLLYVVVIDRVLAQMPPPWTWARRVGLGLLMATGGTAAVFIAVPLEGSARLYDDTPRFPGDRTRKVADWIVANGYDNEDLVYAQENIARELANYAGLSVVGADVDMYYLGIEKKELYRRRSLSWRLKRTLDERALEELGIGWIVLSDQELEALGVKARHRMRQMKPVYVVRDPRPKHDRKVWRVKRTRTSSAAETSATPRER